MTEREEEEPLFGDSLGQPSLAVGLLACAPLFAIYEVGLWLGGPSFLTS